VPRKRSPEKRRNLHAGDSILAQVEFREMREGPGHPAGTDQWAKIGAGSGNARAALH
jgi:hypothetical protein